MNPSISLSRADVDANLSHDKREREGNERVGEKERAGKKGKTKMGGRERERERERDWQTEHG